jgi:hypothetical protein
MLTGATETRRRFNTFHTDRMIDRNKSICPPSILEKSYSSYKRALLKGSGKPRTIPTIKFELLPELGLNYAAFTFIGDNSETSSCQVFKICPISSQRIDL